MNTLDGHRIAFLVPSVELGAYWQPVLRELKKTFNPMVFYTSQVWPAFDPTAAGSDVIQLVGKFKFVKAAQAEGGYARGLMVLSPKIIFHLLEFRPHLIFAQAFSVWTVLAVLFQPLGRWQIVIIYDGSSPNSDFRDSNVRTFLRSLLSRTAKAFLSNSHLGKTYLTEILKAETDKVFTKTYLVPDSETLLQGLEKTEPISLSLKHPVFLYVGRIKQRKGLKTLLVACSILKERGYQNYSLLIVGEGSQRPELEEYVSQQQLEEQVNWAGWVDYGQLGTYFQQTDIFVFPTFEDVWGMVVSEAMVFSKPILCSKGATVSELIIEGQNGYIFDPYSPQELADKMQCFLDQPDLIDTMGQCSQQLITQATPEKAAKAFVETANFVLGGS